MNCYCNSQSYYEKSGEKRYRYKTHDKKQTAMIPNPISDYNMKKVGKNGIDTKPMIKGKTAMIHNLIS